MREVEENHYYYVISDLLPLRKAMDAWGRIQRKGKNDLGKKNCVAYPPYIECLRQRNHAYPLPF